MGNLKEIVAQLQRKVRRIHLRKRSLLGFACLFSSILWAQPTVIASLQPERIETGDTTTLLILVSGLNSAPMEIDFNVWASVFPTANILHRSAWRRSGNQWMRRFTLIAFDSANLELPPLKVRLASGNSLETNKLRLTVFPTPGGREITDMAKIRDIRREPESWLDYWPWGAGILVLLSLSGWWFWKNSRKPIPVLAPSQETPPPVSASEKALQKLNELQQKQLWKQDQTKEHYAEISLILREYLESLYGIAALESTTSEIQMMLSRTDFPAGSQALLEEVLQKTDLVKYARSEPSEATHLAILKKARGLIDPH